MSVVRQFHAFGVRMAMENGPGAKAAGWKAGRWAGNAGLFALRLKGGRWHVFSLNKLSLSKQLTAGTISGIQHGLFQIVLRRGAWH
jgi:hypothetical protein